MNLFRKIIVHTMSQKSYQNYLRKKGVSIGENCEIYKSANFGSEPYLIYIGIQTCALPILLLCPELQLEQIQLLLVMP